MHTRFLTPLTLLLASMLATAPLYADHKVSPELAALETLGNQPRHAFGRGFNFLTLGPVYFGHNESRLDPHAQDTLRDIADYLVAHDNTIERIIIHGHASSLAGEDYNLKLSDSRAYRVRDYLLRQGVEPQRLQVAGFGEIMPVDENWTRAGRSRNRRVEIYVIRMP
ncbi:MAG: OmpA family protein [Gammaproteobacteria bacterium]|nr:OmpA family protein [Gammaproteobacteria bacterium]